MTLRASFTWSLKRVGNDGYVVEEVLGTDYKRSFGPMPAHLTPSFAQARRRLIAEKMRLLGASYVTPEFLDTMH